MKRARFIIPLLVAAMVITQYACLSSTNTQEQAEKLIQEKDYQGAIDAYQVLIDSKPGTSESRQAQLGIGKLYVEKMNRPEQGIKVYQDLLAAAPNSKEAAEAHWRLGVYTFKAKDYKTAQKSFDSIVNKFPHLELSHNAQLMLAKSYEEAKNYKQAAEIYDNVANRHPEGERAAQAMVNRARIQSNYLKDKTEAKRTYQSLVKQYGNLEEAKDAIGEAKQELKLMGATIPEPKAPLESKFDRALDRQKQRRERDRPRSGSQRSPAMGGPSISAESGFGANPVEIVRTFGSIQGDEQGTYYDAMLMIANFIYQDENYRDAGALYFYAIELAKSDQAKIDPYSYLRLAICYRKVGMHQRAREVLKKAVRRDREVIDAVLMTSRNQYSDEDYEKTIETLNFVAGLNRGRDPEIYWRMSLAYQKMGNYEKEAEYCERAIAIKTDYTEALESLAYVLYRHLNDKDRAGVFDDLAKGTGDSYASERDLGDLCYKYANYSRAKTKYEAAARIAQREKKNATSEVEKRALDNRTIYTKVHGAMAAYKSRMEDTAQEIIDALSVEYPGHPLIPYGRAQLALLKEDTDTAIAAFNESMEKDPNSDAAPIALGEYYVSQGYADEAIVLWQESLKKNPRNRVIRRRLNELKKQIGATITSN